MRSNLSFAAGFVLATIALGASNASAVTLVVPGTSNPYLAGLPNGSTAIFNDIAPKQSPVQVTGVSITGGGILNFSATGSVNYFSSAPGFAPDGGNFPVTPLAQNGIAGFTAPISSLVGVFLNNNLPTASSVPSSLDFNSASSTAYSSLSPLLKQVFFIGDGLTGTGSGTTQSVVVPFGATRLYLGTADNFDWNNNFGQFTVNVTAQGSSQAVPEPFTIIGTLIGGTAAIRMRKKIKSNSKV